MMVLDAFPACVSDAVDRVVHKMLADPQVAEGSKRTYEDADKKENHAKQSR